MSHFDDFELQRWRDAGPGADRARVVEHLAVCSQCAGRYAAAIRNRPLRAEPASDAAEFRSAGMRIGGGRANRRRWAISLAAAAVLAIVVAVPIEWRRHDAVPELHLRGGNVVALTPEGAVSPADMTFMWSSAISARWYRIEIADASHVIVSAQVAGNRYSPPSSVSTLLQPNVEYSWTVTALDDSGKALTKSAPRTFVIGMR